MLVVKRFEKSLIHPLGATCYEVITDQEGSKQGFDYVAENLKNGVGHKFSQY